MAKSLLCRLRWHKWQRMTTADNKVYRGCARCGEVDADYHPPGTGIT